MVGNESIPDMLAALEAGIDETNRLERGEFDGLLGNVPKDAAPLLSIVVSEVRACLLSHCGTDAEARTLLERCDLQKRLAGLSEAEKDAVVHDVAALELPDDVVFAIRLLNEICRAYRSTDMTRLIFGKAGARDKKRQAGTRKAGKVTGEIKKAEAAQWHETAIEKAKGLISSGKAPHEVTALVAKAIGKSATTVRPILQAVGIARKTKPR